MASILAVLIGRTWKASPLLEARLHFIIDWVWQEGARPVLRGQQRWEDQPEPVQRGLRLNLWIQRAGCCLCARLHPLQTCRGHHDAGHLGRWKRCRTHDGGAKWCGVWMVALLVRIKIQCQDLAGEDQDGWLDLPRVGEGSCKDNPHGYLMSILCLNS